MASPRSSRAPSISSERLSNAGSASTAAVYVPNAFAPPPAYVAVAAASQIVTDHHNARIIDELPPDEAEYTPAESARFSDEALALLNAFLDSLLFSVLATARSQSIATIRPAVLDVLKPRLAREAMKTADDELSGLLAGGEEDEEFPNGQGDKKWCLEPVFRRTRLRIMVYTRLGELEDEDEERFLADDDSHEIENNDHDDARDADLVSWAAAIFLTSVIEYIAEQTLIVAGHAAFSRARGKKPSGKMSDEEPEDENTARVIVQDFDMEKVALNSALGRLWRTWKKTLRAPITPLFASSSARTSIYRSASIGSFQRRYSTGNAHDALSAAALEDVPEVAHSESDIAANIPLPMSENDVKEIEVPGLAKDSDDDEGSGFLTPVPPSVKRPTSWFVAPNRGRLLMRTRSSSMPSLKEIARKQHLSHVQDTPGTPPFVTPAESFSQPEDYMETGDQIRDAAHKQNERETAALGLFNVVQFGAPPRPKSVARDSTTADGNRDESASRTTGEEVSDSMIFAPERALEALESEVIGLAKTSDVAMAAPPSPLYAEMKDVARKEKRARRLSASPPIVRNNPGSSSEQLANRAPMPPSDDSSSEPSSMSSDQTPVESARVSQYYTPPSNRMSHFRSQTVSTQASHTIPAGPPSISAFSSGTQDSSNHRRSIDSARSGNRSRAPTGDYGVDRATLQRVSSVSSAGTSILHTSRGSESSIPYVRPRTIDSRMSEDDRAREFDTAVAQADTVYYTLTPERMREISAERERQRVAAEALEKQQESPRSPTQVTVYPRVIHTGAQQFRSTVARSISSRTSSKHGKSSATDRSFFDEDAAAKEEKAARPTPINEVGKTYVPIKHLPREPRVQTDPTFELRDFLLSTPPSGNGAKSIKPIETLLSSGRSMAGSVRTTKGRLSKSDKNSINGAWPSSPVTKDSMSSKTAKKSLEARSAAGPSHVENDLIDLIRQGPPGGSDRRIPRHVAPFRDTMDSDQLEMYSSNVPSVMSQRTTNSRSGLLPQSSKSQPAYSAYSSAPQKMSAGFDDSEPTIVKNRPSKRLDPYAIPDDDELELEFGGEDDDDNDEDELMAQPPKSSGPVANTNISTSHHAGAGGSISMPKPKPKPKPRVEAESMMDFLNSEPPPPTAPNNNKPQPFFLSESTLKAIKAGGSATAASANGVRATSSHSAATTTMMRPHGPISSAASIRTMAAARPIGSSASNFSAMRRGFMPARDARMDREESGGLNDMADFLMNSGPPQRGDDKPLPFVKLGKDGKPVEYGREGKGRSLARFWKR